MTAINDGKRSADKSTNMSVLRSKTTTYLQRLVEAGDDLEQANVNIRQFVHTISTQKLLDCYFSLLRFDLELKTDYSIRASEGNPYHLLALHVMLVKKQFDIDNLLMMINKNTVRSHLSILQRLFTNNRASSEVVAILNKVTDLNPKSETTDTREENSSATPLPAGLSRFDMSVAGGFNTIIGQDAAVQKVKRLVHETMAVSQPLSIVLYGPPGTGKTSMALAVGHEFNLTVYTIAVASLGGFYVGEREKNIVDIFNFLENRDEDLLLFIDEADSFLAIAGPNDSQQVEYTRAVTIGLFEKFLRHTRYSGERRRGRIVMMATNFKDRVAGDILRRSSTILIDLPRSPQDMARLAIYYREKFRINMTEKRLNRIVRYSLRLGLAPSHLSQVMRRISTQILLEMLKRGVVVQRCDRKTSNDSPHKSLVSPVYTISGTTTKTPLDKNDIALVIYNFKHGVHRKRKRVMLFSGDSKVSANAIYPYYDGDIERFFRTFAEFDAMMNEMEGDDSTRDPDYVEPDDPRIDDVEGTDSDSDFGPITGGTIEQTEPPPPRQVISISDEAWLFHNRTNKTS